jgi:hypothetical protein
VTLTEIVGGGVCERDSERGRQVDRQTEIECKVVIEVTKEIEEVEKCCRHKVHFLKNESAVALIGVG